MMAALMEGLSSASDRFADEQTLVAGEILVGGAGASAGSTIGKFGRPKTIVADLMSLVDCVGCNEVRCATIELEEGAG